MDVLTRDSPPRKPCGWTRARNSACSRMPSKSESLRAWARLAGLTAIADLSALMAAAGSPERADAAAMQ